MVAFAMHLLRTVPGLRQVSILPDGEHGKRFDFQGWLGKRGFVQMASAGNTTYGGTYAPAIAAAPEASRQGDAHIR